MRTKEAPSRGFEIFFVHGLGCVYEEDEGPDFGVMRGRGQRVVLFSFCFKAG